MPAPAPALISRWLARPTARRSGVASKGRITAWRSARRQVPFIRTSTPSSCRPVSTASSTRAQGWGLGATATWYGNSGFYVDAQAQANWYDSDLGVDAVNPTLANGNKGFGYALSLEAGQRIAIDQNW
ncbi:autotransporter outer membrane beta-barrel domain-containing protein, partial [Brucella intermedia]|uniref:autotransporter outer membrane beta-barrel domain-containing protein n=1 Tax=Brucella intermedia TaxID=94625 RepID=UPI00399D7050